LRRRSSQNLFAQNQESSRIEDFLQRQAEAETIEREENAKRIRLENEDRAIEIEYKKVDLERRKLEVEKLRRELEH
jgi:hypothetical protein